MERRLHSAVADQKKSLMLSLASKEDTAKRFSLLSKKLKEVTELLNKQNEGQDDAMLMKKNFGPMNCVSCEKNLSNVAGMPAEHHGWKKLPFRENNNERIARYAQGFSKMLSTLQPDPTSGELAHNNS
jgi:phage-related protein